MKQILAACMLFDTEMIAQHQKSITQLREIANHQQKIQKTHLMDALVNGHLK